MAGKTSFERMVDAGAKVSYLTKDGSNDHFGYKFLSEALVKEKGWAALRASGYVPKSCEVSLLYVNESGTNVIAKVTLAVSDGECDFTWQGIGQGADKGDKAAMKAQTAAYREALKNGLGIASGDDPEKDTSVDRDAVDRLVAAVEGAKTVAELESYKNDIKSLKKGSPAYTMVVSAAKKKKEELSGKK